MFCSRSVPFFLARKLQLPVPTTNASGAPWKTLLRPDLPVKIY